MYGALGSLLLKAAPHLLKHAAVGTGLTAAAGYGMQQLGGQGKLDQMYKDSLEYDQTTGTYKPRGVGAAILKNFVTEEGPEGLEAQKQKAFLEQYIVDSGGSLTDFEGKYGGQTSRRKIDSLLRDKDKKDLRAEQQRLQEAQLKPLKLQMQQEDKRAAESYNLAMQTRADAMLMNASSLALQREQLAQQDRQYNSSLDRQERLDQERAFLALMGGGLDALGAAFA